MMILPSLEQKSPYLANEVSFVKKDTATLASLFKVRAECWWFPHSLGSRQTCRVSGLAQSTKAESAYLREIHVTHIHIQV